MERAREDHVVVAGQQQSWEWTKLIRKLRWIGLDDEARRPGIGGKDLASGRTRHSVDRAVQHGLTSGYRLFRGLGPL